MTQQVPHQVGVRKITKTRWLRNCANSASCIRSLCKHLSAPLGEAHRDWCGIFTILNSTSVCPTPVHQQIPALCYGSQCRHTERFTRRSHRSFSAQIEHPKEQLSSPKKTTQQLGFRGTSAELESSYHAPRKRLQLQIGNKIENHWPVTDYRRYRFILNRKQ